MYYVRNLMIGYLAIENTGKPLLSLAAQLCGTLLMSKMVLCDGVD